MIKNGKGKRNAGDEYQMQTNERRRKRGFCTRNGEMGKRVLKLRKGCKRERRGIREMGVLVRESYKKGHWARQNVTICRENGER